MRRLRAAGNSWQAGSSWLSSAEQAVVDTYVTGMYNYYQTQWTA